MKLFWFLFGFGIVLSLSSQTDAQRLRKKQADSGILFERLQTDPSTDCRDGDGVPGRCIDVRSCQSILSAYSTRAGDPTFRQYLQRSVCDASRQALCCPNQPQATRAPVTTPSHIIRNPTGVPRTPPTLEDGCGYSANSYKKVIGGQNAKKGAWPWMALIGYDEPTPFRCGGALITARHVLTAAHCLSATLTHVRLGEHDLSSSTEAVTVDINVVRYVRHPEYNNVDLRGDLAVLFLERNAPLDDHINPICLPSAPQLRSKSYVNHTPFIAGWGQTQVRGPTANILQELQVPIHPNQECAVRYTRANYNRSANQFDSAILCAGILTGGQDSCKGDSGGPLMIPETYTNGVRYYIVGVVSYGIGCAKPGIPGVYASVQFFMDWILEQIATGA